MTADVLQFERSLEPELTETVYRLDCLAIKEAALTALTARIAHLDARVAATEGVNRTLNIGLRNAARRQMERVRRWTGGEVPR